jgi:HlyD family secretion protein
MLEKVTEGLPVVVTTDAMPDREFYGKLSKVAVMPDSQSRWLNPDLKVYNTEVLIEGDTTGLRPGMSCQAEIIVKEFQNTLYVPIQAVIRVEGQPTVFVVGPDGKATKRQVDVGLDNNRMIRVQSGLQAGEQVLLNPPLPAGAKDQGRSERGPEQRPGQEEEQQGPDGERQGERPQGDDDGGGYTERPPEGGGRDAGASSAEVEVDRPESGGEVTQTTS